MGPDLLHWMSECVPDGGQFLVAEPGALGVPDGDLESTKATVCEAVPTAALAAATAALSVGVGFLPVSGAGAGLGTVATVSVLAATAAIVQPQAGHALDAGRLITRAGLLTGLLTTAAGLAAAMLPGLAGVLLAAALIGTGTGLITPLGFAALAASTPEERMGQTVGSAELGRELGDAGGPLLVAGVATVSTLTSGYAGPCRPGGRRAVGCPGGPPPHSASDEMVPRTCRAVFTFGRPQSAPPSSYAVAEGVAAGRAGRRTRKRTGVSLSAQKAARTLGLGWKLKTPLRRVLSQLSGGIVALMSNMRLSRPGWMLASCRSWMP
jgi:MFS family permease